MLFFITAVQFMLSAEMAKPKRVGDLFLWDLRVYSSAANTDEKLKFND